MIFDLSLIRIVGLVVGVLMFAANFLYHRGPRWSRPIFGFVTLAAVALIVISLAPQTVNGLQDMLSLKGFAYGRLLALTIVTSFAGILLALYARARADDLARLLDRVVCADTAERALATPGIDAYVKPIMVIVAALDEQENLALLLPRMPREICSTEVGVLLVDDGSSDATSAVAATYGCLVARNVVSRGQGAALRVGYLIASRKDVAFAVTMDGDNQHRPEDLPVMLAPLLDDRADFVIGSRTLGGAAPGSPIRAAGVVTLSRLISLLSGQRITDCSSGFRAFRMSKMKHLDLREDQYQTSEVIIEAAKKGLRIEEVPIYIDARSHGESRKGANVRYGLFFIRSMVKTWWR